MKNLQMKKTIVELTSLLLIHYTKVKENIEDGLLKFKNVTRLVTS
ncbi:hypothetical protein LC087_05880 [Bacillus carboniphilus]|uniref:Uncharacterized protein n=1 Tax=Bacillus carboniphilus TaxID=86663 RepID=A0ABY9JW95_9BACI|nr:hypothetical protein [Bacillus carboniphilus]WLR43671.1 hypothetical protein LC087_05880 [Bacillus carboniphilus]